MLPFFSLWVRLKCPVFRVTVSRAHTLLLAFHFFLLVSLYIPLSLNRFLSHPVLFFLSLVFLSRALVLSLSLFRDRDSGEVYLVWIDSTVCTPERERERQSKKKSAMKINLLHFSFCPSLKFTFLSTFYSFFFYFYFLCIFLSVCLCFSLSLLLSPP